MPKTSKGLSFGFFTRTPFLVFDFRVRLVAFSMARDRCDRLRFRFLLGDFGISHVLQKFIQKPANPGKTPQKGLTADSET